MGKTIGRLVLLPAIIAIVLFALLAQSSLVEANEQRVSRPIGLGLVELDESFVVSGFEVQGFVPTGSSSEKCLATLTESDFAVFGTTLFCNARVVDGVPGIRVHIFLDRPAPEDAVWAVTVYQERAKRYGQPIPCSQVEGC